MGHQLHDLIDEIDRLYANAWLDIRHRERFYRRLERDWPMLAQLIREAARGAPALAGVALAA